MENTTIMTKEAWKAEFNKALAETNGSFSWSAWWGRGYTEFKTLLKEQHAELEFDEIRSGRCIDCGAGVAVNDIELIVDRSRVMTLRRHRDTCDCD
jgi:hypothetical protein